MTLIFNRRAVIAAVALIAFFAISFLFAQRAEANPSSFCQDATASATSSLQYMSPGAATTTLAIANCLDRSISLNSLVLAVQYTASSTAPTLNWRLEGSYDGVDWYPLGGSLITSGTVATSTQITGNFAVTSWIVGTSTDSGGSGTTGRVHTSVQIPVLAPYERVKFYVPAGGGNGGLYAQFIGTRQIAGR